MTANIFLGSHARLLADGDEYLTSLGRVMVQAGFADSLYFDETVDSATDGLLARLDGLVRAAARAGAILWDDGENTLVRHLLGEKEVLVVVGPVPVVYCRKEDVGIVEAAFAALPECEDSIYYSGG